MKRKYSYNENYFETIDTNEKAYWLGFITADGYVMNNSIKNNKSTSTGLRIRLSYKDNDHLVKLNEALEYNKPIKIVKNYGKYGGELSEFAVYSHKIVNDLNNNGITCGNKSCNEHIPDFIDKNLIKNFILGLFDGDGHITHTEKSTEWGIVSSYEMCNFIKEFLESELNITLNKISKDSHGKELYRIRTTSKTIIKILYNYFYENECSKYYLDRKYDNMKTFK